MLLCDAHILAALKGGSLKISPPPDDDCIQPASIDLRLGNTFAVQKPPHLVISTTKGILPEMERTKRESILIEPGQFLLGTTRERVEIDKHHAGRVEGKSSFGRIGLLIHATAGFIDPGFRGHITLEFFNLTRSSIELVEGQKICQLAITALSGLPNRVYGQKELRSHYQDQEGVTPFRK